MPLFPGYCFGRFPLELRTLVLKAVGVVGLVKVRYDAEVYRVIREDLGDFDRYLASLGHYVKAELT